MKKILLIFIPLLIAFTSFAEYLFYKGTIGTAKVTLKLDREGNDGFYIYDKWDTPISLRGWSSNDTLYLKESSDSIKEPGQLQFLTSLLDSDSLSGEWVSADTNKRIRTLLRKYFQFDYSDTTTFKDVEIPVASSTPNHYFKILISNETELEISGVHVYEKQSDSLIQTFDCSSQYYAHAFSVDDFNEDGYLDFSILLWLNHNGTICDAERYLWNPDLSKFDAGIEVRFNGQQ